MVYTNPGMHNATLLKNLTFSIEAAGLTCQILAMVQLCW